MTRIAVFASGGGSNLQALIGHFNRPESDSRIALVASNRKSAGALARAESAGIPTAIVDPEDGIAIRDTLSAHSIDFLALAGYLKRVPPDVVAAYPRRILNVHPGPLPEFGGPGMYGDRVHAAVLERRRSESAVTVHFVDDEYDRGAIVAQLPVPVEPDDTVQTLAARVLAVEHVVYPRAVAMVIATQSLSATHVT